MPVIVQETVDSRVIISKCTVDTTTLAVLKMLSAFIKLLRRRSGLNPQLIGQLLTFEGFLDFQKLVKLLHYAACVRNNPCFN